MTQSSNIKLVLFDLGGVMVRLCGGWRNACQIAEVPLPAHLGEETFTQTIANLVYAHETGQMTDDQFLTSVAEVAQLDATQVMQVMIAWIGDMYPGYDQLIDQLKKNSVTIGCLSNTNAIHWRMMTDSDSRYKTLARLDHHFASQLIGEAKPNPGIFEHVENHLQIQPDTIAFFDDSPTNIEAASSRGWHARLIDSTGCPASQISQHLIEMNVLSHITDQQ